MMSAEPADDLAAAERLIKLADAVVSIDHTVMTFSVGVPAAPDYPRRNRAGNPARLQPEGGFPNACSCRGRVCLRFSVLSLIG